MKAAKPESPAFTIHGTLIGYQGIGCLLMGESGTGKSRLAAETLVLGAKLIADDQVRLSLHSGLVLGSPVPALQGVIELRGVGLAKLPDTSTQHMIHCVVELTPEAKMERLPERETREFLGVEIPLLHLPPIPASNGLLLLATIKAVHEGRILPPDWRPNA